MKKKGLLVDTKEGFSVSSFAAALVGLGVPERELARVIKDAAGRSGVVDAHFHREFLADDSIAYRLHIAPVGPQKPLSWDQASIVLEDVLSGSHIKDPYAEIARRALLVLQDARYKNSERSPDRTVSLNLIGSARTPYKHEAPYQPRSDNQGDGEFYIEVLPQYRDGLRGLETFEQIYILAYLNRSLIPEVRVNPPWRVDDQEFGVFATRSPNRPSPIGLTRVRLRGVEGSRILTGPLDLFDGTPILDIKPYIQTIDAPGEDDPGNDGWLEGSDHLELHRLGIPHSHPGVSGSLSQPGWFLAVLAGIAWGMGQLGLDCSTVVCSSPVVVGTENDLSQEARSILEEHGIPYETSTVSGNYITPESAAFLAALSPEFSESSEMTEGVPMGYGLGDDGLEDSSSSKPLTLAIIEVSSESKN